jgi:hypothetical protein
MTRLITEPPIIPLNVAAFANQVLYVYIAKLKSDMKDLVSHMDEARLAYQQIGFLLLDAKVIENNYYS